MKMLLSMLGSTIGVPPACNVRGLFDAAVGHAAAVPVADAFYAWP
jgi:hypothetical protein